MSVDALTSFRPGSGSPHLSDMLFDSISKTLTAVGLMQLWERGEFGLDDSVNDYLKSYRVKEPDPGAPPVTFRHMLSHASGIGELRSYTDLLKPVFGLGVKSDKGVSALADYYVRGLKPKVYPDKKWAYSNHTFATLGQVIEDISDASGGANEVLRLLHHRHREERQDHGDAQRQQLYLERSGTTLGTDSS